MARNVQQYLYNYHLTVPLKLQVATLYVCDQFCEQATDDDVDKARRENASITGARNDNTVAISLASCSIALLVTSMTIVLLYK